MHAGWARSRVSDTDSRRATASSSSSSPAESTRARRFDGLLGVRGLAAAPPSRPRLAALAAAVTPDPKWPKMSLCDSRYLSRACAASAMRSRSASRSSSMFSSRCSRSARSAAICFFRAALISTFFRGFAAFSSSGRLQPRGPVASPSRCARFASCSAAAAASASSDSRSKRARSCSASLSNFFLPPASSAFHAALISFMRSPMGFDLSFAEYHSWRDFVKNP